MEFQLVRESNKWVDTFISFSYFFIFKIKKMDKDERGKWKKLLQRQEQKQTKKDRDKRRKKIGEEKARNKRKTAEEAEKKKEEEIARKKCLVV